MVNKKTLIKEMHCSLITHSNSRLTSTELSQLWTTYLNDSASVCTMTFYLNKVEDPDVKKLLTYSLRLSKEHMQVISSIFNREKYPPPKGFQIDEDVHLSSPRLFSDTYYLNDVAQMAKIGLNAYSMAVCMAVRKDVSDFFNQCLKETIELNEIAKSILLSKGLYYRSPSISTPDHPKFATPVRNILNGLLNKERPLNVIEISHLYSNIQRNGIGKATLMGFSQVAQSKVVKEFLIKGRQIADKNIEVFTSYLKEEELPVPFTWESEVTDSTTRTFSEKLLMFHTGVLTALGIGYYGASISMTTRVDLNADYHRLLIEGEKYALGGVGIMVKNNWYEEPPMTLDRDELARRNIKG